jgi:hypothetical protein
MHQEASIIGAYPDIPGAPDRAASGEVPIFKCGFSIAVELLAAALEDHPAWDRHTPRQEQYVHAAMSDIWLRYNAWENYHGSLQEMAQEHESVWYPAAFELPAARMAVNDLLRHLPPVELGMVLITKIPAGKMVAPHIDGGWHATHYNDKYGIQIKGNQQQSFDFVHHTLSTEPGEVFWFDNSQEHCVMNGSDEERITMIVCTRRIE